MPTDSIPFTLTLSRKGERGLTVLLRQATACGTGYFGNNRPCRQASTMKNENHVRTGRAACGTGYFRRNLGNCDLDSIQNATIIEKLAVAVNPILLVNPNRMKPAVAPLALDYLAEALEQEGLPVEVLDLCFCLEPHRAVEEYLRDRQPLLIAVTLRNTDDVYYASQDFCLDKYGEIIGTIRRQCDCPLVLGGAGFSVFPEAMLDYFGLDLGIWGEGETSLPLLARCLAGSGDLDRGHAQPAATGCSELSCIPSLVYRGADGALRRNPPAPSTLASRPALRRTALYNRRYFMEGGQIGIEAKRGCVHRCHYCADPLGKGPLAVRPPGAVAEEMKALLGQGIDHFHFCDSEFNLPLNNAVEVCRAIIEGGFAGKVRWYAYASPVPFSDELAGLFLRAGCAGINFGADSGNNHVLRRLGRDFNAADLTTTARVCHRQGLNFMYDLLLGGPGETRDSLGETIDLMKRIQPARVGVSLGIRLFPGTRLAAEVVHEGPLASNPNIKGRVAANSSLLAPVFYLAAELGADCETYLASLIGDDERFFFASRQAGHENYNYNDNSVLVQAIRDGARGAYWDILRRV